jgi:hypothetical protein
VYIWDSSTKRWVPEQGGGTVAVNSPADNVGSALTTTTPASDGNSDAALRVQLADMQRQLRALNDRL